MRLGALSLSVRRPSFLGKLLRLLESEGIEFHADGSVELVERARPTMRAQIAREAALP